MPRRPKKGKSSSLLIRNLVKDLNPLELTVLRERILHICEMTQQDIILHPKKYERHIISPALIISCMEKVITGLAFEDKEGAKKVEVKTIKPEMVTL